VNPIKVAHITTSDITIRHLILNLLRSLQQSGYDVTGISAPGPGVPAIAAAGVRHIAIPLSRSMTPGGDLIGLWQLYRTLRRERFTIVHTHTPKGGLLGQYAALLAGVPIRVHTIHGLYFPAHMKSNRRWLYVWLERLTMFPSHMNLAVSPEDVPIAIKEHICAPDRITLVQNGISIDDFNPAPYTPEKRSAIRAALGLSDQHKIVGIVARFVAEKGYREMLAAAQIIKAQHSDTRFIFIGPVESFKKDALDPQIISDMSLNDVVQFLGYRADMPDLYSIMDVFALPSYREGMPYAPMEASAMGIPCVVTDVRGCRQTVDHGVTGYIIPVRDAEALATALTDLLDNDEKRLAFGLAARQKAVAEFDERVAFDKIKAAYAQLLNKAGFSWKYALADSEK